MTPTLESALSGLPAKPRVHELSKRIGISNKELLAALADRGLTVSSASSSVPLAVAQELIESLLGGQQADIAEPESGEPAVLQTPAEPSAADIPGDSPGQSGHEINPLFLPPAEFDGVLKQQGRVLLDQDATEGESGPPARSGSSRRRRGRSGGGRRPAQDSTDNTESDTVSVDDTAQAAAVEVTPDLQSVAVIEAPENVAEDGDTDEDEGASAGTDNSGDEGDDDSGSRGRRRRRGRRGRGRVSDNDDRAEGPASEDTPAAPDEVVTTAPDGELAESTVASSGESDDDSDEENETDGDTGSGGTAGNRRRRRRRRRSTGDEAPREDDPDNTVVHVREPRLSQAGSSAAGSASAPSNEVQGVRGSTRLEAKRQRRRDSRDSSRRRPQILTEAEFLARRESVERVMAVRQRGDLAQVALLEDGILVEHFVSQTGSDSMIGSVFLGKVQNVLPSMEAAFCDIGRGRNAVIYAGEVNWDAAGLNGKARRIETALSSGDTILAQVSKDPVGHKGARLTTQISLPGRFVVYVPGGGATGISRKLPDTERRRLKTIMDRIVPEDAGVIIRTAAEGIAEEELARDVERLKLQWEEITRRAAEKTSAPTQLYGEPGTLIKVIRDLFNSDITRLVIDGDDAYEPVAEYINAVAPELADRLVKYETNRPGGPDVFAAYRIDEQIAKALERKVHLPSGGSLVIDRTEAMTVVDVNTGKYTGSGGNLEETVTKNNLEAAEEMVRQLRLRDIGGIIVIDFIDMVLESNRELVLRRLTEALGRDRTRHQVAEVTSLGLVQMTRKRMGTGLVEAFSEPCPHCGGRGLVLHDLPVVASPIEDNFSDRRSGKTGRRRGRDTDRVEEIVVPRVVEQAVGRRPDPRGPKPPMGGAVDHNGGGRLEAGNGVEAAQDTRGSGPSTAEGAEIDWIEAAASAGIQAAEDADEDGFEAHQPGSGDGLDEAPVEVDEVVVEVNGDARGVGPDDAGQDENEVGNVAPDYSASDDSAPDGAPDGAGEVAPVSEEAAPAPERRRRGRRSAGRPAGAPPAAEPVDMVIRDAVPEPQQSWTAPSSEQGSDDHSSNGHDEHSGPANGNGSSEPAAEATQPPAAPAAPPRRRRAASRPAGPAAGVSAPEPVVISIPAESIPTEQPVS
jgi:ribonuclease E